jgi:fibronectin type 3 domain-containing protein
MAERKTRISYALFLTILFLLLYPSLPLGYAIETTYLNNVSNNFQIDGFTNIWFNTSTDQRDISVRFDSSTHRIITGVRLQYRTARLLADYADCPVTYKFESGSSWVDYNDLLPNTTGDNRTHVFHCQGDMFLITNSFFYISMGCGSDDPYIQVGVDTDHSGHSEYSFNGGGWTLDTVEYLVEALVEDISVLDENKSQIGEITVIDDFIDAYKVSLVGNDDVHFSLQANASGEYFNMRFFNGTAKLTPDSDAIWLEEGATTQKTHHYRPTSTTDYILLVEPNTDGIDNGTYILNWTYNPAPPPVNQLPPIDNDGNIQLSWNVSIDTDIAYYNVYRGTTADFPNDLAHMISSPGEVTGTTFEDLAWLPDDQYFYVVAAVDNSGHESLRSNAVNTTVMDTTAPENPVLQSPIDSPVDADGFVNISWNPISDGDLQYFRLYRARYSAFPLNSTYLISSLSGTSYQDFVPYNGPYFYKVSAVDDNGLESNGSNEVQTTVVDAIDPGPPENLTIYKQDGLIILNWSASVSLDLDYYLIYRATIPIHNISTSTPVANTTLKWWIDADLAPGTYHYAVIAVDLNGRQSNISNTVSINIPKNCPYTLFILISVLGVGGVVMGYAIYDRRRNPNSKFHKFNRANLKSFFGKLKRKPSNDGNPAPTTTRASRSSGIRQKSLDGIRYIGHQLIRAGSFFKLKLRASGVILKSGILSIKKKIQRDPMIQRIKIDNKQNKSHHGETGTPPSESEISELEALNESSKKNLHIIFDLLRVKKELSSEDLLHQTELSALEIQQCLAFLSAHHLILIRIGQPDFTPHYRLNNNLGAKWANILTIKDNKPDPKYNKKTS